MALDYLHVNDLATATLDDTDQIIVGEGNTFKKATLANLKGSIIGSDAEYTEDTVPYLSARQTKNAGIVGKVAMEQIVGGSLGWNQLANSFISREALGLTITVDNTAGSITVSGTATATNNLYFRQGLMLINGHKYLLTGSKGKGTLLIPTFTDKYDNGNGMIFMSGSTSSGAQIAYGFTSGQTYDETLYPQFTDLTLMLGSTIADYIYQLETATAGAGIAKLKEWGIDLDTYHAYDAGSIQSVEATAHVTKDANNNTIGNYPLGSDTLRGIPQLVNNELSYDGDVKTADGTINRRYVMQTLDGSEAWTSPSASLVNDSYLFASQVLTVEAKAHPENTVANAIGSYMLPNSGDSVYGGNIGFNVSGKWVGIRISGVKTKAELQTYLAAHPLSIVYERAAYVTESSTPYQRIQTVDADGTESFTTNTVVPVGHKTLIPENVLGALQTLVG